ncbi:hypothetical protein EON67_00270 [archaeon]|nr:MAG: hypothetical protein EON67_00270 [archaeon]
MQAALPLEFGGTGRTVLYINTEDRVPTSRMLAMARGVAAATVRAGWPVRACMRWLLAGIHPLPSPHACVCAVCRAAPR